MCHVFVHCFGDEFYDPFEELNHQEVAPWPRPWKCKAVSCGFESRPKSKCWSRQCRPHEDIDILHVNEKYEKIPQKCHKSCFGKLFRFSILDGGGGRISFVHVGHLSFL